ncbi:hypothetical protein BL253_21010 [Pseudofrankia asymbiotica]|uniref:Uncharacterized protein n=1 Tax=Pseudofrankia asymbiotica TaxID=1834516 RepID=A0A1V2I764_9ACTN|nr:hypothetical protein BL253_21010 [Pseudofrankia asymbiotica]
MVNALSGSGLVLEASPEFRDARQIRPDHLDRYQRSVSLGASSAGREVIFGAAAEVDAAHAAMT